MAPHRLRILVSDYCHNWLVIIVLNPYLCDYSDYKDSNLTNKPLICYAIFSEDDFFDKQVNLTRYHNHRP